MWALDWLTWAFFFVCVCVTVSVECICVKRRNQDQDHFLQFMRSDEKHEFKNKLHENTYLML